MYYLYYMYSSSSPAALMQYRLPVGAGPSSKTWPRCAPLLAQTTSTRGMKGIDLSTIWAGAWGHVV